MISRDQVQAIVDQGISFRITEGDLWAIRRIVGRYHVGEPARVVARGVARKIKGFGELDRGTRAEVLRAARNAHRDNRRVYFDVVGWRP